MGQFLTTLKTGSRAALVAVLIGGTTLMGAAPVQAQGFSFNFGIDGGGSSFSYGIKGGKKYKRDCLSNREIARSLRDDDWSDIRFGGESRNRVTVVAENDDDGRDYSMRVNRCTGEVSNIKRVRRGGGGGSIGGSGITLDFNF